MMGTINCTYETPCGWCTKWDKKCDSKIPTELHCNSTTVTLNKICKSIQDHKWKLCTASTAGNTYECEYCGHTMFIPYENLTHSTTSVL